MWQPAPGAPTPRGAVPPRCGAQPAASMAQPSSISSAASEHSAARLELSALIITEDRRRFLFSLIALLSSHLAISILWSGSLLSGVRRAAVGYVTLPLLLAAQRFLLVRLVPPIPASHKAPGLVPLSGYLAASIGGVSIGLLLFPVHLLHTLALLEPCDADTHALYSAHTACAWAAANALAAAVASALDPPRLDWPFSQQMSWLALRSRLKAPLAVDAATSSLSAIALLLGAHLFGYSHAVRTAAHLVADAYCPAAAAAAAAAAAGSGHRAADGGWLLELVGVQVGGVPPLRGLLALLLAPLVTTFVTRLARVLLTITYARRAPSFAQLASSVGSEAVLLAALRADASALTQHLGYLELALLTEFDPPRRRSLFQAAGPPPGGAQLSWGGRESAAAEGADWDGVFNAALLPIDALTQALGEARKQVGEHAPPTPP